VVIPIVALAFVQGPAAYGKQGACF